MDNMRRDIFFVGIMLFFTQLHGQKCCNTEYEQMLEKAYPGITAAAAKTFETTRARAAVKSTNETLRIPVVFHIIHNDSTENLSDELVFEQLDILNKDFQRLNEDAANIRDTFLNVVGSPDIEFYLANIDPEGFPTSGITRTFTNKQSFLEDLDNDILFDNSTQAQLDFLEILNQIKFSENGGINAWDTNRYLNIWLGDISVLVAGQSLPVLLGFGFPPISAPNWEGQAFPDNFTDIDGVVVHYEAFGTFPPPPLLEGLTGFGRTLTHEVGHYLGLRHIWGDGDCEQDDGIEDTPAADGSSQPYIVTSCEQIAEQDSCPDDLMPDMIENYMDYSREICQNSFTIEQSNLMRAMLEGPRADLMLPFVVSGVNEVKREWSIFPNPSADKFISLRGIDEVGQLSIYNSSGQLQVSQEHNGGRIYIGNLLSGVYLLELRLDEELLSRRFVVQN